MPTENKPAEQFRREDRYIVIKRTDMEKAPADLRRSFSGQCRKLHDAMFTLGAPARSFAVVESDWPEYGFVWLMLEHRMAGFPVPDFNAVKCAADVAAAQSQLEALKEDLELLKTQAINDAEANTAIRAERDALQLRLNAADQRIDELLRPHHDDEQTLIAQHQWFVAGEFEELIDQASDFQDKAYTLGRARGLFDAVQQPAQVAVVLPACKPSHATAPDNDMRARLECKNKGYNEALDDVARLNIQQ